MNFYFLIYIISAILVSTVTLSIWARYRGTVGIFFGVYGIGASIWILLYFAFFLPIFSEYTTLVLSRINYGISLVSMYSFLGFLYFFPRFRARITKNIVLILGVLFCIFCFASMTPLVIDGLRYDPSIGVYREIPGVLYTVYTGAYIVFFLILFLVFFYQIREQRGLNRVRLIHISIASAITISILILLQVILPLFDIWILERELVIFFDAYVLYMFFTLRRYYFAPIWYDIGKSMVMFIACALTIGVAYVIKMFGHHWTQNGLWIFSDTYGIVDTLLVIALFALIYRLLYSRMIGQNLAHDISIRIKDMKRELIHTTNMYTMNAALETEMHTIFRTRFAKVIMLDRGSPLTKNLSEYFSRDPAPLSLINDVHYFEDTHIMIDRMALNTLMPREVYLMLPIFDIQGVLIALFALGSKPFGGFYDTIEIAALSDFTLFLAQHIRYIETYTELQDISRHLDKRVDEKTIEYNALISKQRDFISTISHEIRTPVTSSVLQLDLLAVDIEKNTLSPTEIQHHLDAISTELVKTGDLLTRLFSIEYIDKQQPELFLERVHLSRLLKNEYDIRTRVHGDIQFTDHIDRDLGYGNLDRVQFQQVLANLINNAVKFADPTDPHITISASRDEDHLRVTIEDNGSGFSGLDTESMFEKYTIGHDSVGLGIGLYLCKRIIDMHHGTIMASVSPDLGGMCIVVDIPLIHS